MANSPNSIAKRRGLVYEDDLATAKFHVHFLVFRCPEQEFALFERICFSKRTSPGREVHAFIQNYLKENPICEGDGGNES